MRRMRNTDSLDHTDVLGTRFVRVVLEKNRGLVGLKACKGLGLEALKQKDPKQCERTTLVWQCEYARHSSNWCAQASAGKFWQRCGSAAASSSCETAA
jgi:hypothetical protein